MAMKRQASAQTSPQGDDAGTAATAVAPRDAVAAEHGSVYTDLAAVEDSNEDSDEEVDAIVVLPPTSHTSIEMAAAVIANHPAHAMTIATRNGVLSWQPEEPGPPPARDLPPRPAGFKPPPAVMPPAVHFQPIHPPAPKKAPPPLPKDVPNPPPARYSPLCPVAAVKAPPAYIQLTPKKAPPPLPMSQRHTERPDHP